MLQCRGGTTKEVLTAIWAAQRTSGAPARASKDVLWAKPPGRQNRNVRSARLNGWCGTSNVAETTSQLGPGRN